MSKRAFKRREALLRRNGHPPEVLALARQAGRVGQRLDLLLVAAAGAPPAGRSGGLA